MERFPLEYRYVYYNGRYCVQELVSDQGALVWQLTRKRLKSESEAVDMVNKLTLIRNWAVKNIGG